MIGQDDLLVVRSISRATVGVRSRIDRALHGPLAQTNHAERPPDHYAGLAGPERIR
jgi:hypothetical protein